MTEITEWLERFRRGPELFASVMTGVAGADLLDFKPDPTRWSIRQVACHLADSEVVGAVRFRTVIAEDNPNIFAFKQEAWAERLDYQKKKMTPVLESFRRVRTETYDLLKDLPEDAFKRMCNHSERGPMSLFQLLQLYAQHTEKHAQQIQTLRAQYKEAKAARA